MFTVIIPLYYLLMEAMSSDTKYQKRESKRREKKNSHTLFRQAISHNRYKNVQYVYAIATTNDHLECCRKSKMDITWASVKGKSEHRQRRIEREWERVKVSRHRATKWNESERKANDVRSEKKWNLNCIAHQIELKGGWKSSEKERSRRRKNYI